MNRIMVLIAVAVCFYLTTIRADLVATSHWVVMTSAKSDGWRNVATKVVGDIMADELRGNEVITDPAQQYTVVTNFTVTWDKMLQSKTTAMWGGKSSPAAPFANEKGCAACLVLEVKSSADTDEICLADLEFLFSSSDPGNILGKGPINFADWDYGPSQIEKSDGTVVSSGSTTQKGKRLAVPISRVFEIDGTASILESTKVWFEQQTKLRITVEVKDRRNGKAIIVTSICTGGAPSRPEAWITPDHIHWSNGVPGWSVGVEWKSDLGTGPWSPSSVLTSQLPRGPSGPGFYRLRLQ